MKRAIVVGILFFVPALGIAQSRSDGFPDGGKLVYGEYGRPATLDPITSNDMVGLRLTELLFNGLVSFSPKNDVVPDLAEKWEVSADNRVYTFKLRDGVKWPPKVGDRSVSADDVVGTLDVIRNPRTLTPLKAPYELVADARKLDAQTVEITLKRPVVNALGRLSFKVVPTFAFKRPDSLSRDDPFVQAPAGTGPFQLSQVTDEGDVVMEANDRQQLVPMIEQAETTLGEKVGEVLADSGYASYDNYEYLSQNEKKGYIPDQYFEKLKQGDYEDPGQRYHKENFRYDSEEDVYICPEGKELRFYKERDSEEGVVARKQWIYKGSSCVDCSVCSQCTKMKYRTIARDKREPLQQEMRRRLLSEEGKTKYKKRLLIEAIFGHFKYNLGYKTFLLRTLEKVRGEFKLMCIGYNLRKIFRCKAAKMVTA